MIPLPSELERTSDDISMTISRRVRFAAVYEVLCQAASGVFSRWRRPSTPAASCRCRRVPAAVFRSILSAAARPSPNVGPAAAERMLLLWPTRARLRLPCHRPACRAGQGARPRQPSIRGEPATVPSTSYRVRPGRPARQGESPPIERTVPVQDTRRQNGGSLRLGIRCSSGGPPALLLCGSPLTAAFLGRASSGHRGCCGRSLGVPPGRRIDQQTPVLLRRSLGQFALLHIAPQRDQ